MKQRINNPNKSYIYNIRNRSQNLVSPSIFHKHSTYINTIPLKNSRIVYIDVGLRKDIINVRCSRQCYTDTHLSMFAGNDKFVIYKILPNLHTIDDYYNDIYIKQLKYRLGIENINKNISYKSNTIYTNTKKNPFSDITLLESPHLENIVTDIDWFYMDDGLTISCDSIGMIALWDIHKGDVVYKKKNTFPIMQAAFSKSQTTCHLVSLAGNNIHLFDTVSCSSTHVLKGHKGMTEYTETINKEQYTRQICNITSTVWVPYINPYTIASGGIDGSIRVWDIRSCKSTLLLHPFGVCDIDIYDNKTSSTTVHPCHFGFSTSLLSTNVNPLLYSIGSDKEIYCWDLERKIIKYLPIPRVYNYDLLNRLFTTYDSKYICIIDGYDVHIYNIQNGSYIISLFSAPNTIRAIHSIDNQSALIICNDGTIVKWDTPNDIYIDEFTLNDSFIPSKDFIKTLFKARTSNSINTSTNNLLGSSTTHTLHVPSTNDIDSWPSLGR